MGFKKTGDSPVIGTPKTLEELKKANIGEATSVKKIQEKNEQRQPQLPTKK